MGKGSAHRFLQCALFLSLYFHLYNAEKQKRQIFREQVLPSRGGKIPEEAFRADRLALNRLNKEGISIPDGVILDARHIYKHPNPPSKMPEVLKVFLTAENRYVPPEGRYINEKPKSVDTTYLVRHPVGSKEEGAGKFGRDFNSLDFYQPERTPIYTPLPAPLIIPTRGREEFRESKNFYPTWRPDYSWRIIYEPNFSDYFVKSVAVFNSHQTIFDYDGLFDDFYDRSIRHVQSGCDSSWGKKSNARNSQLFSNDDKDLSKKIGQTETLEYPSLKEIPETGFACGDRIGTFADHETRCQVFHQCTTAGKSSFLCSEGTIFSEVKKRCEWSNTVACETRKINH